MGLSFYIKTKGFAKWLEFSESICNSLLRDEVIEMSSSIKKVLL